MNNLPRFTILYYVENQSFEREQIVKSIGGGTQNNGPKRLTIQRLLILHITVDSNKTVYFPFGQFFQEIVITITG